MGDNCDYTLNQLEELIKQTWDALFSPLHAASYILNPRHFGKGQTKDKIVMTGNANRRVLREQPSSYWRLKGFFRDEDVVDCRDKMDLVAFETPNLQTFAVKIESGFKH
ncbi:hypothetical protein D8674_021498 [Pyrus ussuriensis x Pyrus communis]|uniref:Uncharacterized protein n=1 Tax=Pyrus ussuriensis x Pyrus communis TaxID=2448454 RepID=A0A5N5GNS9_9ROSA|nr:hypothetical protein D8674_021498 [Pyrus ussuriensis x Pyrus communis]